MYEYIKTNLSEIEQLRKLYLDSLPVFQELFMEWKVKDSICYTVKDKTIIGYFALAENSSLVEFFVNNENIYRCEDIFEDILNRFDVKNIFCKSFDSLLLKCCLANNLSYKVFGYMFRDCLESNSLNLQGIDVRRADEKDYERLVKYDNELYETKEELIYLLKNNNILMYFNGNRLIGCGFLIRINENYNYYDIGMWIDTQYRKQGYGTKIISDLKNRCTEKNLIPIAGCAEENIGSRKTLEKCGFRSKYDLIEFKMKDK